METDKKIIEDLKNEINNFKDEKKILKKEIKKLKEKFEIYIPYLKEYK